MPPIPDVKPLPKRRRLLVFIFSLVVFSVAVPAFVFYAIGYRFDFSNEISNIRAVGGMYISADVDDIAIYIDDEPVEDMRIFQNAAYIQNLEAGLHQVHVQGENIQTWVKTLPVYAHYVTEAAGFNMPTTPQVRLITEYVTDNGDSVVAPNATSTFAFATTTNIFYATSTTATSTFSPNSEYAFVESLFASTTQERSDARDQLRMMEERFRFGTISTSTLLEFATTTKTFQDIRLYKSGEDVFAHFVGDANDIPYYYCVTYTGPVATSFAYGSHVYTQIEKEFASTTDLSSSALEGTQLCRREVRIDRLWQDVHWFDFYPNSSDLVLMHLTDGLYVVEIDDRSWQNTQLLYPGEELIVVLDGGQIFIQDGDYFVEVFTENIE